MTKKDFRKNIRFKFLKDISIILFIGTCVTSAVIGNNVAAMLKDSLTSKGMGLAANIANRNENALIISGNLRLNTVYTELNTDEEIIYTIIRNNEGKILTTQFESINYKWPGLKDVLQGLSKDCELPDILAAIKHQVGVKEVSVPIMLGVDTLGTVTIGLSEHKIHKQIMKTVLFLVAMSFSLAFILGVVLFISSKKTILDPIIELGRSAARFAKGDLSTRVTISATGEIQELVGSFNQMAKDLEKTTVSRDYVDSILRNMTDTLIMVSTEGAIQRMNAAACALLGRDEDELIGRPINSVLLDPAGGNFDIHDVLTKGPINNAEKTYLARDGGKVPVLFSASALVDSLNRVQGIVCVAHDITERKHTEAKLKNYSLELEAAHSELKNITNIFFHDLRTPLVNVKGFTSELQTSLKALIEIQGAGDPADQERVRRHRELEQEVMESLRFIDYSVNKMDVLIKSVLELWRMGNRNLRVEPVDAGAVVRTAWGKLADGGGKDAVLLKFDSPPVINADRKALNMIMEFLLDNGLKYLDPDRAGEIEITTEQNAQETIFHIRDNGKGISRKDIPTVFELFRRVGKQEGPGQGMGLVYVKTLVRRHGGRIWCESEPGKGSVFSFTIPHSVQHAEQTVPEGGKSTHGES
ncbi:MAG: ATP-binding protein [Nitrospirae bacterium]|nr:ATP-binding protein [Nitrospirota bacterium]